MDGWHRFYGIIASQINGIILKQAHEITCLSLKIDENLTWKGHIEHIKKKVATNLHVIKKSQSIC